ncbi:hypothetical protein GGS26DRAFT_63274 [Hypomontagnella submonticulosa]|nr:hypothetical protein GGS26DRAFT_63274 [Hypomontagnella submonticulosa]
MDEKQGLACFQDVSDECPDAESSDGAPIDMQEPSTPEGTSRKLACPFAIIYPDRFPDCHKSGGWKSTSRVKEHIYRSHSVCQCPGCGLVIDEKQETEEQIPPPRFAINQRQKKILRKRGGLRGMDEGQRWNKIFRVIHPDATSPYPSPYLDSHSTDANLQECRDLSMQAVSPSASRDLHYANSASPSSYQISAQGVLNKAIDDHQRPLLPYSVSGPSPMGGRGYAGDSVDDAVPTPAADFGPVLRGLSGDPYHGLQFYSSNPVIPREYFPEALSATQYGDTEGSAWASPTLEPTPSVYETGNQDSGYGAYAMNPGGENHPTGAKDFFTY